MNVSERSNDMKHVLWSLFLLSTVIPQTGAAFDLPPGRWWQNEQLAERIGLTPEQQNKIHTLVLDSARRMVDLSANVRKAEIDLREAAGADQLDIEKVRASHARMQAARMALENDRFELLLSIRQLLTTEQWRELTALKAEHRQRRERLQNRDPRSPLAPRQRRPQGPGARM